MYGYSPKAQEIFNKVYRQDTNLNHNVDYNKDNYKEQLFKYKYADTKIMHVEFFFIHFTCHNVGCEIIIW